MKAAIVTLGCKTNQFESAALAEQLQQAGYELVPFEAGAELVLVNTCTVTARTDAQSRNLVRRAHRLNPAARVVVTGCYAQVDPAALAALPGVSLVLGNEEKRELLRLLQMPPADGVQVSDIRRQSSAQTPELHHFAERSRAFVQIQNGCDAFCSYCIIPYARGASRSVPPEQVVSQVQRLCANGYREVVLTGIHIGGYGRDLSPPLDLAELVRRVTAQTPLPRLRLGSIEPGEVTGELLALAAGSSAVCPHFHIPLQSGSDSVLRRMNRHYGQAEFAAVTDAVVRQLPDAAIGLDVIAGFPGETEVEFADTLAFIESLPVAFLHVFPYSRRPGTPAASMPQQLPTAVIRERAARLRQLGEGLTARFAERFIGRSLDVVLLGGGRGLTRHYLEVELPPGPGREGELAEVVVERRRGPRLVGRPVR